MSNLDFKGGMVDFAQKFDRSLSSLDFRGGMVDFAQKFDRIVSNLDFGARRIMLHENLTEMC